MIVEFDWCVLAISLGFRTISGAKLVNNYETNKKYGLHMFYNDHELSEWNEFSKNPNLQFVAL